jgi:endoglucanase
MSIARWFLAGFLAAAPAGAETAADRFQPKRGLNFEIWNEWITADEMVSRPGFLDIYPDWRRLVPPKAVSDLKTKGFDFVRLPFDPSPLLRLGPGQAQDALIEQIHQTATDVQSTGLKVIVDLHSIPREKESWGTDSIVGDPDLFAAYVTLVGKVAVRLNGMDPDRTALELLNEPTGDCDAIAGNGDMLWPDQLAELHKAARTGAPDLPLILSGACWGGVDGLTKLDPSAIADDNVLWSLHSYDPFLFTHQSAHWTGWLNAVFEDVPYPPNNLDDAAAKLMLAAAYARAQFEGRDYATPEALAEYLREYRETPVEEAVGKELMEAAAWADQHGIPRHRLILGEFGAMRDDAAGRWFDPKSREAFLADKRRVAEDLGIGWAVWVWSGTFGIVEDDTTRSIAPQMCAALGLLACPS